MAGSLKKNAARVIDLFREWDTDGNGEISRSEFHKAIVKLGFDAPKSDIDELFTAWDPDGSGTLDFKELRKILKTEPSSGAKRRESARPK